jgi:hypothetical protein
MTLPASKLEIAFGISATAEPTAPQWVDVSAYMRSFDVERGRQRELDTIDPGEATFTLDNRDRRFDPDYAAGPYYPNVLPMVHVRFTEAGTGTVLFRGYADRFKQEWTPGTNKDATATLECHDGAKVLEGKKLAKSIWEREIGKLRDAGTLKAWFRLADPKGTTTAADAGPNRYAASVKGTVAFGQASLLPFGDESETGAAFAGNPTGGGAPLDYVLVDSSASITTANWTIEVLFELNTAPSVGQVLFYIADKAALNYILGWYNNSNGKIEVLVQAGATGANVGYSFTPSEKPRHLMVKRAWNGATGTVTLYIDGTQQAQAAFNSATAPTMPLVVIGNEYATGNDFAWGRGDTGSIQDVAWYESTSPDAATHAGWALTPGQGQDAGALIAAALDDISWPAALRDIDTGKSTMQPHALSGSVLDYCRRLTDTEEGLFYMARDGKATFKNREYLVKATLNVSACTFGDGGGAEIPYRDVTLDPGDEKIVNEATTARLDGIAYVASDSTSQAKYFVRTIERRELLTQSEDEARQHGYWYVRRFKDNKTAVTSLGLALADTRVTRATVLGLSQGQLVTVKRRPPGGGTITKTGRIEGVRHQGQRDGSTWEVTFWLSGWDATVDQPWILGDATYGVLGTTTRLAL